MLRYIVVFVTTVILLAAKNGMADEQGYHRATWEEATKIMSGMTFDWKLRNDRTIFRGTDNKSMFDGTGQWKVLGRADLNNGWPKDKFMDVKALVEYKGKICTSIRGDVSYNARNLSDVYCFDGNKWEMIGGNGVNSSWSSDGIALLQDLLVHNGDLFAAIGGKKEGSAQVWRFNGSQWQLLGGEGKRGSWTEFNVAYSMEIYKGELFVGLQHLSPKGPIGIYRYNFSKEEWSKAYGKEFHSWPDFNEKGERTYINAYEMRVFRDKLYLSMSSIEPQLHIWSFDGRHWKKVAGGGVGNSWKENEKNTFFEVGGMALFQNHLIASLGHYNITAPFEPIWAYDGAKWHPVAKNLPYAFLFNNNSNSVIEYCGRLYGGAGNKWVGGSLWELEDGKTWRLVLGFGKDGALGAEMPDYFGKTFPAYQYLYNTMVWKGRLVVSTGGEYLGAGQVWIYEPGPDFISSDGNVTCAPRTGAGARH